MSAMIIVFTLTTRTLTALALFAEFSKPKDLPTTGVDDIIPEGGFDFITGSLM